MRAFAGPVRRTPAALLVLVLTVATLAPAWAVTAASAQGVTASATTGEEESAFLQKLNDERRRAGLSTLVSDGKLAPTSRSWSQTMAGRNQISHDPDLARIAGQVEPRWRAVGENVGVGYTVQSLHDAFMASSGHRDNVLRPGYNRVGIGVVHSGGRIWVTVRFLEGPAIVGSTGGAPSPVPGVRSALSGDFDGDGYDDLLTYGPGTSADELWFGQASRVMRKVPTQINGQYRPVSGDFDGDGDAEVLWYAPGGATDYVWEWRSGAWASTPTAIHGTYRPLAGDFDGDGIDDILWYAPGRAGDYYWYGRADGSHASVPTVINGTYEPLVGDLDGNGGDDVFWYAPGGAPDFMWYATLQRASYRARSTVVNGSYKPFAGDFDGNGTDDLFWYAPGGAGDYVWFTDETIGSYRSERRVVTYTYLPAAADFDRDSADDVVWFSPSSASGDTVWFGAPGTKGYAASTFQG